MDGIKRLGYLHDRIDRHGPGAGSEDTILGVARRMKASQGRFTAVPSFLRCILELSKLRLLVETGCPRHMQRESGLHMV